jgi:hypothetical protein
MTTFTLQDLTPAQQEAVKQHEAMHAAHQVVNTRSINNLPTTTEEDEAMKELFEKMGQDLTAQHAPAPQPSQVNPEAVIEDMVAKFSISLRLLLTTVLSQSQAETKAGENSLQECVSTTLQQADWFKEMVGACIDEDMVRDAVKDAVESEVDTYFSNEFDPTYHFDFGDAVSSEVSDQLDDVVRDRLDEVVQEQLEEVVAEKLKSIRVVFD